MKTFWNISIVVLLVILIVLVLFKNRQETEMKINLAERKVEEIPVRIAPVEFGVLNRELVFHDEVKPTIELRLNAPVQGKITKIFMEEGAEISKNALLLKTEDDYLQAEYNIDKKNYELAKKNLSRVENLNKENAIPKNQFEQLETQYESAEIKMAITEKRLNETWVKSPTSGFINQIYVKEGMLINPSVPLAEIVDISSFKVILYVSEFEVVELKKGMDVEIIMDARPEEKFIGKITSIAVNADFALKYSVIIDFKNNSDWLKGGMSCTIKIGLPDSEPGFLVPSSTIINEMDSNYVYIIKEGVAIKKAVNVLSEFGDKIKITSEISENDKVVAEGQSKLHNNQKVKILEPLENDP